MENASKALIIAGAILLSILIIGLGMLVFNQAKEALTGSGLDSEKVTAFNSKFETYIKDGLTGTQVRILLDTVKNNNVTAASSDLPTIYVFANTEIKSEISTENGKTTAIEINTLKNGISNSKKYKVTAAYDKGGYIYEIGYKDNSSTQQQQQ